MASLLGRIVLRNVRRPMTVFSKSLASKAEEYGIPEAIDHATGIERKELLAELAGNDDPFCMKPIKRGAGTKENPNLIPSAFDSRIIGCICEEESPSVIWMWVHKDIPRRCDCGHWFKLVPRTDAPIEEP